MSRGLTERTICWTASATKRRQLIRRAHRRLFKVTRGAKDAAQEQRDQCLRRATCFLTTSSRRHRDARDRSCRSKRNLRARKSRDFLVAKSRDERRYRFRNDTATCPSSPCEENLASNNRANSALIIATRANAYRRKKEKNRNRRQSSSKSRN